MIELEPARVCAGAQRRPKIGMTRLVEPYYIENSRGCLIRQIFLQVGVTTRALPIGRSDQRRVPPTMFYMTSRAARGSGRIFVAVMICTLVTFGALGIRSMRPAHASGEPISGGFTGTKSVWQATCTDCRTDNMRQLRAGQESANWFQEYLAASHRPRAKSPIQAPAAAAAKRAPLDKPGAARNESGTTGARSIFTDLSDSVGGSDFGDTIGLPLRLGAFHRKGSQVGCLLVNTPF